MNGSNFYSQTVHAQGLVFIEMQHYKAKQVDLCFIFMTKETPFQLYVHFHDKQITTYNRRTNWTVPGKVSET